MSHHKVKQALLNLPFMLNAEMGMVKKFHLCCVCDSI